MLPHSSAVACNPAITLMVVWFIFCRYCCLQKKKWESIFRYPHFAVKDDLKVDLFRTRRNVYKDRFMALRSHGWLCCVLSIRSGPLIASCFKVITNLQPRSLASSLPTVCFQIITLIYTLILICHSNYCVCVLVFRFYADQRAQRDRVDTRCLRKDAGECCPTVLSW